VRHFSLAYSTRDFITSRQRHRKGFTGQLGSSLQFCAGSQLEVGFNAGPDSGNIGTGADPLFFRDDSTPSRSLHCRHALSSWPAIQLTWFPWRCLIKQLRLRLHSRGAYSTGFPALFGRGTTVVLDVRCDCFCCPISSNLPAAGDRLCDAVAR
jgi:hypothetical protein